VDRPGAQAALAMVAAVGRHWLMRDRYADAVSWIDQALSMPGADAHQALRFSALRFRMWYLRPLGRVRELPTALAEGNRQGSGRPSTPLGSSETSRPPRGLCRPLRRSGHVRRRGAVLGNATGDAWDVALALNVKAEGATTSAQLRSRVDRAASLLAEIGNRMTSQTCSSTPAYAALCAGSDRDAKELVERADPIARGREGRLCLDALRGNLGLAALLTGDTDTARHAFREELTLCRELVVPPIAFEGLRGLAAVAVVDGDAMRAATLLNAARAHRYGEPTDALDARLETGFFDPTRSRHSAEAWDAAACDGGGAQLPRRNRLCTARTGWLDRSAASPSCQVNVSQRLSRDSLPTPQR
jgi:hypothetical protein